MRRWYRSRRVVALGAMAVLGAGAAGGAAYGYFSTTGSGAGAAQDGTMVTVTLATAGTPTSPLLPGTSGDVVLAVTNPNTHPVSLTGVGLREGGAITATADHSGCTTTDDDPVLTLDVPAADLPLTIPAGAVTDPVDLSTAVTMDASATNTCQGATFSIPVTVTAETP